MPKPDLNKKHRFVNYSKWGYIFIAPFFLIYFVFSFLPLLMTFYYSFFEYYRSGLFDIGPNFVGLQNYANLFSNGDFFKYALNTLIIWFIGFVPQMLVALLLAVWFTSYRLKLKGQAFFKTVTYMPNLIMASALAMLFFSIFTDSGPINQILL